MGYTLENELHCTSPLEMAARRAAEAAPEGVPSAAANAAWAKEALSNMAAAKAARVAPRGAKPGWDQRIVASWRRDEYDASADRYCPLRFKKERRRRRRRDAAVRAMVEATTATTSSSSSSHSAASAARRNRPQTASASFSASSTSSSSSSRAAGRSERSRAAQHSRSLPSRSLASLATASARPSTAGAPLRRRRRRRPKPAAPPQGGITFQQSAGQGGARDDLSVVFKIMDRESVVARVRGRAAEYLKHHRWAAVSVSTTAEGGPMLPGASSTVSSVRSRRSEGALARATALITGIRQDLNQLRTLSVDVLQAVFRWRQDQMLTLHETQNPTRYAPYPFVYNGEDYVLRMVSDLNFLKDVQPITLWLGAPMVRNPFALEATDPLCMENLAMQSEEDELALCAYAPPPPPPPAPAAGTAPATTAGTLDSLQHVRWASLLMLAQEVVYGTGPEPASLVDCGVQTASGATAGSSILPPGSSRGISRGGGSRSAKGGSGGGMLGTKNMTVTTASLISENTIDAKRGNGASRNKLAKRSGGLDGGSGDCPSAAPLDAAPPQMKAAPKRLISRVHQVISQNAVLRRQLTRMRDALERERRTLQQLEQAQ